ncbi:30S ribosomal protein S3 [Candidatus Woesearchaeota archaeon]|nr:30S ribosomal protein S3 [Candidatus Woesearchaeota archaeon]
MIERQIVQQRIREFEVQEYLEKSIGKIGHSHTKIQRTPLGDKVIIFASRPGLIIGRQGQNIKALTKTLKNKFKLENPQIEINEVENVNLDAKIVAENIAGSLERFGPQRFKGIGYRVMTDIMDAKALGVEILISGKIPGSRARTWRFYKGYLKKCGDIATTGVDTSYAIAQLKSGIVGIRVKIMPPTTKLPYHIELIKEEETVVEETKEKDEKLEEVKVETKERIDDKEKDAKKAEAKKKK